MVYFGPELNARVYFVAMGFASADRQTTASFLVTVTAPNGRTTCTGFEMRVPRMAAEMVAVFQSSAAGCANRAAIKVYRTLYIGKKEKVAAYRNSALQECAKHTVKSSTYTISIPIQMRAVMVHRVQITKGNIAAQGIQLW